MKKIARVFIVLFCLTFLCNKALSEEPDVVGRLGKVIEKLMVYTVKGLALHAEIQARLSERIEAMEKHLAETTGYVKPTWDRSELEKAAKEYEEAFSDLLDEFDVP